MNKKSVAKISYPLCAFILLVLPLFNQAFARLNAGLAVLSGILLSLLLQNPYQKQTKEIATKFLSWSIIGLGFGMNLIKVAEVGLNGITYTIIGISFTLILGIVIGKILNNKRDMSLLISVGTAICGGSAIAALAPAIKANNNDISVSLAIIFILNALALFIFPPIGEFFNLTQEQFGLWSALAIHDTSSVVGATLAYGEQSLEMGTTVKLARAIWIVPVVFLIGVFYAKYIFKNREISKEKVKKPWFIIWFLLAAALVTWVPFLQAPGQIVRGISERMLIIILFCIGSNLSRTAIKSVGIQPFIQGILLWIIMASLTFVAIYFHKIGF
ncbi:YeiH family protein [Fluviispira sanaruensis]|uniref:Putative sulfate exporter family transporter n=1 Tax=Fluviispira sanaruensis TaxID=2493639 RepID=A0A4P2VIB0_FLUSA|nr:putative sulfate exporter family transporter [Fluviispira sanaruensis]BBH52138.1 putative sulfate exporter family transporter [Fluviispira sanaruensis]